MASGGIVVEPIEQSEIDYASKRFPVVEIFGPTVQGEGALAGSVSHFVRFGGCDYACDWCDSAPAVLPELVRGARRLTQPEILAAVSMLQPAAEWVTLSGGNPALHDIDFLVRNLGYMGFKVAVETQGSRWKEWLGDVEMLTISPKPPSSGMTWEIDYTLKEYLLDWHSKYTSRACFKVPVFDRGDFEWAVRLHRVRAFKNIPFYLSVVTRMGGLRGTFAGGAIDTTEDILDRYHQVIDWTLDEPAMKDVRVIPQLHALVWGHARGH